MSELKTTVTTELDFSASFEICEFVRQMSGCDDNSYYRYLVDQLKKKSWTPGAWNLLISVVTVVFFGNSTRKIEAIAIAREMGATL